MNPTPTDSIARSNRVSQILEAPVASSMTLVIEVFPPSPVNTFLNDGDRP